MARCAMCKANLGFGGGTSIVYADYLGPSIFCDDCKQLCDQAAEGNHEAIVKLQGMPSANQALCDFFEENEIRNRDRLRQIKIKQEKQEDAKRKEATAKALANEMIMTTGNNLEGYRVVKYLGIVFGDTVFKQSVSDSLSAGLSDFARSLSFSAQEMTGAVSLIENGREFAIEKLKYSAAKKGANAIISVDFEDTFGKDVIHVSVNGTAVIIEPID